MKGVMLILEPYSNRPKQIDLAQPPELEALQKAVGGYIEKVPGFDSVEHAGELRQCVALVNEEGKLDRGRAPLPANNWATIAWDHALRRSGHPGLVMPSGKVADFLVGNIVILYGDDEFMEAL